MGTKRLIGYETTVGTKQLVTNFHMIGILKNCPFKPSLVFGGSSLSLGQDFSHFQNLLPEQMRTSKNDPHLPKKAVTIKDGTPLRILNGLNLSSMVNHGDLI